MRGPTSGTPQVAAGRSSCGVGRSWSPQPCLGTERLDLRLGRLELVGGEAWVAFAEDVGVKLVGYDCSEVALWLVDHQLPYGRAVEESADLDDRAATEAECGKTDRADRGRELRPFLPVSNGRCGRWRDHRQVIDGILHRIRTGVHWRDLPERYGPWKTVYERHRAWSADGTRERLLQQVQAAADAAGQIDWEVSVDSTAVRAHQHAAGARIAPPTPVAKGDAISELTGEAAWRSLRDRLAEAARVARDWAGHAAGSPPRST